MFDKDTIHERGRALEDEFFHRVDEKLRAELQASMEHEEAIERLKSVSGFDDPVLVEHLHTGGFTPESIAALALVPAVFVAWADGSVTAAERQAILSAALQRGIAQAQPLAYSLLETWLHERPSDSLWRLWQEYASSFRDSLTPTVADMLHKEILGLATAVAMASGGIFGRGKISAREQSVLNQIAELSADGE